MLDTTSTATIILLAAATALLLAAMLYPSTLLRWLQRKRYQYEVTFSLYMLTPTEKFIFSAFLPKPPPPFHRPRPVPSRPRSQTQRLVPSSQRHMRMLEQYETRADAPPLPLPPTDSFLFLFLSMIIIAASLYLPEHVAGIANRAFYYWAGDDSGDVAASSSKALRSAVTSMMRGPPARDPLRGQGGGFMEP
jgi:hypothetical protein